MFQEENTANVNNTNNTPVIEPPRKKYCLGLHSRREELIMKKKQKKAQTQATNVSTTTEMRIDSELDRYLDLEPMDQNQNPLKFWRDHQNEYPLLAKMVKTYDAFQPTSVSSERIFNKDKLIYTNRRKCILPERSEKFICLQEFYRNRDDDSRWRICSVLSHQ